MQYFIISFIGEDRPGFVHEITDVVNKQNGNWLESRMTRLGGKFAGLARVSAAESDAENLEENILSLAKDRFSLIIRASEPEADLDFKNFTIDILGNDRPGILNEITRALAEHHINLVEVTSTVSPAPMTGVALFSCAATIEVDPTQSMSTIDEQLSNIADELGVDILLEQVDSE